MSWFTAPCPGVMLDCRVSTLPLFVVPLTVSGYSTKEPEHRGLHNLFSPAAGLSLTDASQDHYKKQKLASQTMSTSRNATRQMQQTNANQFFLPCSHNCRDFPVNAQFLPAPDHVLLSPSSVPLWLVCGCPLLSVDAPARQCKDIAVLDARCKSPPSSSLFSSFACQRSCRDSCDRRVSRRCEWRVRSKGWDEHDPLGIQRSLDGFL